MSCYRPLRVSCMKTTCCSLLGIDGSRSWVNSYGNLISRENLEAGWIAYDVRSWHPQFNLQSPESKCLTVSSTYLVTSSNRARHLSAELCLQAWSLIWRGWGHISSSLFPIFVGVSVFVSYRPEGLIRRSLRGPLALSPVHGAADGPSMYMLTPARYDSDPAYFFGEI